MVDLLLRWVHILAAISAAGGILFWRFVLIPAMSSLGDETKRQVVEAVRGPWAKGVMLATLALLITGFINAWRIIQANQIDMLYHILVMVKFVLAIAFFYVTARLGGRSEAAARYRERLPFWMSIAFGLVLALVLVAGYMKNIPRVAKPASATSIVAQLESRIAP